MWKWNPDNLKGDLKMHEHEPLKGFIAEVACPENGHKWLVITEDHQRHWLTGREFAIDAPRSLGESVVLTYRAYNSFSLWIATKP